MGQNLVTLNLHPQFNAIATPLSFSQFIFGIGVGRVIGGITHILFVVFVADECSLPEYTWKDDSIPPSKL